MRLKKYIIILLILAMTAVLALALSATVRAEEPPVVKVPTADPALNRLERVNEMGFGNPQNRYAWSMVNYEDDIYVGTINIRVLFNPLDLLWFIVPDSIEPHISDGTEVWKYDPLPGDPARWSRVLDDGLGDRHNIGLRKMIVWEDDPVYHRPCIYGTTWNLYNGLEVWRYNGENWEILVGRGGSGHLGYGFGFTEGDRTNDSGRGMATFKGDDGIERLYVGTMSAEGGQIWRYDGVTWEKVFTGYEYESENGSPSGVSDLCVFNDGTGDALYAGTYRGAGFKVFKSYTGDPHDFFEVATDGMASPLNGHVHKLIPFGGRLWVTAVNWSEGFDIYASEPGQPILPLSEDRDWTESWDKIVEKGFTDRLNRYAWDAEVYDNGVEERLYIGTLNPLGCYLYSVTPEGDWAVEIGRLPEGAEVKEPIAHRGIRTMFNYGLRTMEVWNDGGVDKLMLGCAGFFKPVDVYAAWTE